MTKIAYIVIFLRTVLVKLLCSIFLRPFGSKSEKVDLQTARAVLVIRPDEIGDFILTAPFLFELRRFSPNAKITVVVKPEVAAVASLCQAVDEVVVYDHRWLSTSFFMRPVLIPWRAHRLALSRLRRSRFDAVFLPRKAVDQCYATSLAYFSGARNRIGFSEKVTPDKAVFNHGFDMLLTHVCTEKRLMHASESGLELLRAIGLEPSQINPKLTPGSDDAARAEALLREIGIGGPDRVIAFGASAGHSVLKQWPIERFMELGKQLIAEFGCKIVVVGSPDEIAMDEKIASGIGSHAESLAGKTDIKTLAAILARCDLYVGNDIGPTHMAAAVGAKTIALFGASCSHVYAPRGDVQLIVKELDCGVCRNGHKLDRCAFCIYDSPKCMSDITVAEVLKLCRSFMKAS